MLLPLDLKACTDQARVAPRPRRPVAAASRRQDAPSAAEMSQASLRLAAKAAKAGQPLSGDPSFIVLGRPRRRQGSDDATPYAGSENPCAIRLRTPAGPHGDLLSFRSRLPAIGSSAVGVPILGGAAAAQPKQRPSHRAGVIAGPLRAVCRLCAQPLPGTATALRASRARATHASGKGHKQDASGPTGGPPRHSHLRARFGPRGPVALFGRTQAATGPPRPSSSTIFQTRETQMGFYVRDEQHRGSRRQPMPRLITPAPGPAFWKRAC